LSAGCRPSSRRPGYHREAGQKWREIGHGPQGITGQIVVLSARLSAQLQPGRTGCNQGGKGGFTPLVGAWQCKNKNKLVECKVFADARNYSGQFTLATQLP